VVGYFFSQTALGYFSEWLFTGSCCCATRRVDGLVALLKTAAEIR
jgi:hypothetical protein